MLKLLIKKQLMEVFKGYFYDAKKNRARSKAGTIGWILFFIAIMAGVLGGMFTGLSLSLCGGLVNAGAGWLYFVIMSGIAILLGAFGSIFNTYSGLYLSKDNDLLFSMPIPVKYIIISRLVNVYILGAIYSVVAILPALIVYMVSFGVTLQKLVCAILLIVVITLLVLVLSCLLGWCVAKISQKISGKSYVKVLASLAFIGAYYFFYFKAQSLINDLLTNAAEYSEKIRGSAGFLYVFGRVGEGDMGSAAIVTGFCLALAAAVWYLLKGTFLSIATSSAAVSKVRYRTATLKKQSVFKAFVLKELARFTSDSNYMLNCGLGILFIPAFGIFFLIKGSTIIETIEAALPAYPGITAILVCGILYAISSMNDLAAPSVSLEGKSIWIPQSLPVEPSLVLRAKTALHVIISAVPMLFAVVCVLVVLDVSAGVKLLILLDSMIFVLFSALFGSFIGIRMPLLDWTNEIVPIKQSGAVTLAIFGIWAVVVLFAGGYLLVGHKLGAAAYLGIWALVFAAASAYLLNWLDTKGARRFAEL